MTDSSRPCPDCHAHSGISTRVEIHGKLHERIDHVFSDINKRFFQILLGIILCLVTGIVGIAVNAMVLADNYRSDPIDRLNPRGSAPPVYAERRIDI